MTAATLSISGVALDIRGLVHIYRAEGHDIAALAGVDLRILPGYGHGGPGWVEEVLPASIDWLDEVLARE